MAVTIDSANVVSYTSATLSSTCSGNVTCGAGDNRLLVCVGNDESSATTPTSVTYNSVAMTAVPSGSKNNTQEVVSWYYMDNPPTGVAHSLAVTFAANCNAIALLAIPLSGVDTTQAPSPGTGTQGVPSASIACSTPTAGANDMQLAATQNRGTTQVAGGAPQTNVVTLNGINGSASFACSSIVGGNTGNFTWTITSGNWSAIGVTIFALSVPNGVLVANAGEYDWLGAQASSDYAVYPVSGAFGINTPGGAGLVFYDIPSPTMSLVAPPLDYSGAALLAAITQMRIAVGLNTSPLTFTALAQQLIMLEREAIDHFMATYWCIASRILSTMVPIIVDKNAVIMLVAITTAKAQLAAAGNSPTASWCAQYVNQLQTELVDYYMNTGAITAASILNTMTGVQSLPFNYVSNYTYYQADIEG